VAVACAKVRVANEAAKLRLMKVFIMKTISEKAR
jgi:hypothetical protein